MISIGSYEAKTKLPQLLARVLKGERIVITKHGNPVAIIIPPHTLPQQTIKEAITDILEFRKKHYLGGLCVNDLKNEGRM